jgi:type II secretory ATPase GspE/PulE/Tfp pilus assembly ATPase PilB-like protein
MSAWHTFNSHAGSFFVRFDATLEHDFALDPPREGRIARKAPVEELRQKAISGAMRTMLHDGIEKCLAGHTDLKQLLTVCSR